MERQKLSTSKNWAVWVPYYLEKYEADSLRYFLTVNAPENKDTDFSWREFVHSHNSELLGAYGNFINRTLKFIEKYYKGITPEEEIETKIKTRIQNLYQQVGSLIEDAHLKNALELIFEYIREANKYFDDEKPWIQVKEDLSVCNRTMATCIYIISNLSQLLNPFLPFSSQRVQEILGLNDLKWQEIEISAHTLKEVKPLFTRIELERIEAEIEELKNGANNN